MEVVFFSSSEFFTGRDDVRNFPGRGNRTNQASLKAKNLLGKSKCSSLDAALFRPDRSGP